MKSDWLTASSFERMFGIVSAINTLSIQAKLKLAGVENLIIPEETDEARKQLITFLDNLQVLMQDAEKDQSRIVIGADPRLGGLALQFMAERRRLPPRSLLFTLSPVELKKLIQLEQGDNLPELVECLEALRSMLEQYSQADVAEIFGDE